MNNNFLSLPAELLLKICDNLSLANLKNLRLSCRFLAEHLLFLVLSNIVIKAESIGDLISCLQFLTNPRSVAINCTSRITIHGFGEVENDSMVLDVAHADRQKIRDDLSTAFTSLKAVRTVRWSPQENDPLWFQESIWSAICCLPALRILYVKAPFLEINLENLNTLIALESISITGRPKYETVEALFEKVSKLYASSTNLTSIELDGSDDLSYVLPEQSDLYHLLARRPKVDTAIRLRHLALSDIPIRIDENTRHHLNNLTSLKLSLVDAPEGSGSPDEIWNGLRLSRIHLQELDIGYSAMGHAVDDYLSSFSGLKKLRLFIDPFDNQESLEASAVKFWSNGFLNHVDTLQDLCVRTTYDSQWCFGDHNRSVIVKCTKLRVFVTSVYPSDIPQESGPERITSLIETVLTHMPHIKHLGLNIPYLNHFRGSRCGTPASRTKLRHRNWLKEWILKYKPASRFQARFAEVDVFLDREVIVGHH